MLLPTNATHNLVPGTGVEPVRRKPPKDFKSFASTNSATQACLFAQRAFPLGTIGDTFEV